MEHDAALEAAVNTALLYIGDTMAVNAVMFSRTEEDFRLPSEFLMPDEHRIIRRLIGSGLSPSLCFVRDSLFAGYCFAFLEDLVIMVGPFRERTLRAEDVPEKRFPSAQAKKDYLADFNALPLHTRAAVRHAVHLLFLSVGFGTASLFEEGEIDMRERLDEALYLASLEQPPVSGKRSWHSHGMAFYYMEQIRLGKDQDAVRAYRIIMNSKPASFILIETIEGLTMMRALTMAALHEAGVTDTSADVILSEFTAHARLVTGLDQARKLCEKMIDDSCRLVRRHRQTGYTPTIAYAVDYIHRNLAFPISLADIAAEVMMTPNALSTRFHREVGMTPVEYITAKRMEEAARLLRFTRMSVKHICTLTGLMDANYFSRCFRKVYGVPPTEYRRLAWQEQEPPDDSAGESG